MNKRQIIIRSDTEYDPHEYFCSVAKPIIFAKSNKKEGVSMSFKKILCTVLSITMLLGTISSTAFAYDEPVARANTEASVVNTEAQESNVSEENALVTVEYPDGSKNYFDSLKKAIADAEDGDKVSLLGDVALDETVTISGKAITLDLAGKTVSGVCDANQSHMFMVSYGADLKIMDSSADKSGKIVFATGNSATGWAIDVEGDLVLESGTIEITGSWSIGYCVDVRPNAWGTAYTEPTTFTMNGGKLISSDDAIRVASSSADTYKDVSAGFIMNGGDINAAYSCIFIQQSNGIYDMLSTTINKGALNGKTPIRVYAPTPTGYVNSADCMDITLNGGTYTSISTDEDAYLWLVNNVIRCSGGITNNVLDANGDITISKEVSNGLTLAEGCVLIEKDGAYTVAVLPNADVKNLGSLTITEGEGEYQYGDSYYIYDGSLGEGSTPFDLQIAMEFIANDTPEEAAANSFGNYTTDFFITMTGMSGDSIDAKGCYLAGYYPSFGKWVKIPLDGMIIENNEIYPVITTVGFDFKYTDICRDVGKFICGIYLSEDILAANPNLKVKLELGLSENIDKAQNKEFITVGEPYVYDMSPATEVVWSSKLGILPKMSRISIFGQTERMARIRLFAGIDDIKKYDSYGFKYTATKNGETQSGIMTLEEVFETVEFWGGTQKYVYTGKTFGENNKYVMDSSLAVPLEWATSDVSFTITPFVVYNGTEILGISGTYTGAQLFK